MFVNLVDFKGGGEKFVLRNLWTFPKCNKILIKIWSQMSFYRKKNLKDKNSENFIKKPLEA